MTESNRIMVIHTILIPHLYCAMIISYTCLSFNKEHFVKPITITIADTNVPSLIFRYVAIGFSTCKGTL